MPRAIKFPFQVLTQSTFLNLRAGEIAGKTATVKYNSTLAKAIAGVIEKSKNSNFKDSYIVLDRNNGMRAVATVLRGVAYSMT